MKIKFNEKKSNFEEYIFEALTESNFDDCLNKTRKAAEALCKSILYLKLPESEAIEFITGARTVNKSTITKPRRLDLSGLIQLVTTDNSSYIFIDDRNEREIVRINLDSIRLLGNKGSHDKEHIRETQIIMEYQLLKSNLLYLINWCYKNMYCMEMPSKVLNAINEFKNEEEANTIKQQVNEIDSFYELLREWLKILEYSFGPIEFNLENDKIFDIEIPGRRNTVEKILVISSIEHIDFNKACIAKELKDGYDCVEVWIVTSKTISDSARKFEEGVYCYTFDELIEDNFTLEPYLDWLNNYVNEKKIVENFIQLECEIREEHKNTKKIIARSDEEIIKYTDKWLEHDSKDHLSILGDFGTGKTWFSLYYAWKLAEKYKEAKEKGLPRPRIPIVIFLRDYAKAVSVETLISDFFFRKHQIDLKGAFSAFNFLNKHGKLLIIFDGFDEMSDRINKQKMIDNFWELASVIKGNAKVILTCRNEHFPEIKEGRSVLKAEMKESTKHLTGTTPQFETVYLKLLNEIQIKEILSKYTTPSSIEKLLKNQTILDLLKRPVMIDLILESIDNLADLENVDLATIYFYATRNKLIRDIKEERTFTSLADKYFFMCEISQEMLHTNKLSISYKEFPNLIRQYFSQVVKDDEIDYWRYDMHGQTLLIIDEDGQYKPAHKSFLEYFLAFKYISLLGLLKTEYLNVIKERNKIDNSIEPKKYTWDEYFKIESGSSEKIAPISDFTVEKIEELAVIIGKELLTKPMCKLAVEMIDWDKKSEDFNNLLNACKGKTFEEIGYLATNLTLILLMKDKDHGINRDFSNLCLRNLDFNILFNHERLEDSIHWYPTDLSFENSNFSYSDLQKSNFSIFTSFESSENKYRSTNFHKTLFSDDFFREYQIDDICLIKEENRLLVGAHDELLLLETDTLKVIKRIKETAWKIFYLKEKDIIIVSGWFKLHIYDKNLNHINTVKVTETYNELKDSDEKNGWLTKFGYLKNKNELLVLSANSTLYKIDLNILEEKEYHIIMPNSIMKMYLNNSSECILLKGYDEIFYIYDLKTNTIIHKEDYTVISNLHSTRDIYIIKNKNTLELRELYTQEIKCKLDLNLNEPIYSINFNEENNLIYCFSNQKIILIELEEDTLNIKSEISVEKNELVKLAEFSSDSSFKQLKKIICLKEDNILMLVDNLIGVYSMKENKFIKYFKRFDNIIDANFRNCEGLSEETLQRIYQNGGII
ncbi:NACHT domain-containing protein [Rummeliibacillus pycnus]|uniref:NACHT domain-containing protein n=1 Tax=Rummeliibacillus pycnus TaxID=101070 RepID=UPI0037C9ADA5